jgi:hypothetical protein
MMAIEIYRHQPMILDQITEMVAINCSHVTIYARSLMTTRWAPARRTREKVLDPSGDKVVFAEKPKTIAWCILPAG